MATTPGSIASLAFSSHVVGVAPHATNTFTPGRAFMVDTDGTVEVRPADSSSDVTLTVIAGAIYPISIIAVRATGTDATEVAILY